MRVLIIANNEPKEGTFIYNLKYKNQFDKKKCLELINEISMEMLLSKKYEDKENLLYISFNFYSYINLIIISTLNNTNPYLFENSSDYINDYDLIQCLERFREIIKLVIKGDKNGLLNYEDELGRLDLDSI